MKNFASACDVVLALAQRRHLDRDDVEAVVQVLAELARRRPSPADRGWSPRSAARRRAASACRRGARTRAPAGRAGSWPACSGSCRRFRRGTGVPPSACSKRPMRCLSAPVNAPFSWPNSSDSSRFSCSAAQLTLTKLRAVAQRVVVDGAGDELLAGARLAADQHRGVALGHLANDAEHALRARR